MRMRSLWYALFWSSSLIAQPVCDSTFTAAFTTSITGSVATFTATSNLPANGFVWNFGDGTQGGGSNVSHVYAPGGPYTVCVRAWYWNGADTCWTEPACQVVGPFATNNPCDSLDATFTFTPVGGNAVVFQAGTFNGQWNYVWDFGDGAAGTGAVITHVYPGPTVFLACLTVWAWDPFLQDTCSTTSCQVVNLITAGVDDRTGASLTAYPVPARDVLWVDGGDEAASGTVLRLVATDGRKVVEARPASWPHAIPIAALAPGPYVLQWESAAGAGQARLVRVE